MQHIAFILDGNRRWAKDQGLASFEGHLRGYENLKTIALAAFARGIPNMTAFVFSTENWKRAKDEVSYLMDLVVKAFTTDLGFFADKNVRLRIIGLRDGLSPKVLAAIDNAETKTAGNTGGQLNLCFNYGGRAEIVEAVRKLVADGVNPEEITDEAIASRLWSAGIPDPDLIVRTSGEQRLSNFLTWSGVYSELLFVPKHWPAFTEADLDAAIAEYDARQRRFGA